MLYAKSWCGVCAAKGKQRYAYYHCDKQSSYGVCGYHVNKKKPKRKLPKDVAGEARRLEQHKTSVIVSQPPINQMASHHKLNLVCTGCHRCQPNQRIARNRHMQQNVHGPRSATRGRNPKCIPQLSPPRTQGWLGHEITITQINRPHQTRPARIAGCKKPRELPPRVKMVQRIHI